MDLAILVGCSKYDDETITPLRFTANDVQLVSGALERVCDLSPETIIQLHHNQAANLRPTRSNIIRVLSRSQIRNLERLIFFFSGHGFHSQESKIDYLLPEDAVPEVAEQTALAITTVVDLLKQFGARTTLLLLDLCRANVRQGKDVTDDWQTVQIQSLQFNGIATLWSCSPGQKSYEAELSAADLRKGNIQHLKPEFCISRDINENRSLGTLFREHSIVPLKQSFLVQALGKGREVWVRVFEVLGSGSAARKLPLGDIRISVSNGDKFVIVADYDESLMLTICIVWPQEGRAELYQANNFFSSFVHTPAIFGTSALDGALKVVRRKLEVDARFSELPSDHLLILS